jgi:hypothetical protein
LRLHETFSFARPPEDVFDDVMARSFARYHRNLRRNVEAL